MKRRTNKIQENYIIAKATWQAVNEIQKEKFNEFLSSKGIIEDDLNDDNFETLNAEYEVFAKAEIENSGVAWENMKLAETALIEFGISFAPSNIQETLRSGIKHLNNKMKLIEIALNIDIRQLPSFKHDLQVRLSA